MTIYCRLLADQAQENKSLGGTEEEQGCSLLVGSGFGGGEETDGAFLAAGVLECWSSFQENIRRTI